MAAGARRFGSRQPVVVENGLLYDVLHCICGRFKLCKRFLSKCNHNCVTRYKSKKKKKTKGGWWLVESPSRVPWEDLAYSYEYLSFLFQQQSNLNDFIVKLRKENCKKSWKKVLMIVLSTYRTWWHLVCKISAQQVVKGPRTL